MAISSSVGIISDSADAVFPSVSIGSLHLGLSRLDVPFSNGFVNAFSTGGNGPPGTAVTTIEKFPYSLTGGTATDVGDLALPRLAGANCSSTTEGFQAGGQSSTAGGGTADIQKFPFAISSGTGSDTNANLTAFQKDQRGHQSQTDGFVSGGNQTLIDKFPFAISSGTATDVGDLTYSTDNFVAWSTFEHGFMGIRAPEGQINKFPFAIVSGTASEVGNINPTVPHFGSSAQQSLTDAYATSSPNQGTKIGKFPFAIAGGTSAEVGNLSTGAAYGMGTSTVSDGYQVGGVNPPAVNITNIQKFPFSGSNLTSVTVGSLTTGAEDMHGHQT